MKIGGKNVSNTLYIGGQRPFTSADKNNLDKNTSARHTHSNKSVLDGITPEKVSQWDAGGGSGKEDKSNKVQSLSDTSTGEQYPSAKATVDYVKQVAGTVFNFIGSFGLNELPQAHTLGSGKVINITDGGTRQFVVSDNSTEVLITGETNKTLNFPFPLPTEGFVHIIIYLDNASYTLTNLSFINSGVGTTDYWLYEDVDGVLDNVSAYDENHQPKVAYLQRLAYNLSVNAGDDIVSTDYYWDNFNSYIDLSGYATKKELASKADKSTMEQTLATKSNEMKLLNTVVISEAKQSVVIPGTDDGISYAEMPLRKLEIYTFVPKDDSITTANAISTQIGFKFVGDAESLESAFVSAGGAKLVTSKSNGNFGYLSVDLARKHCEYSSGNCGFPSAITYYDIFSYTGGTMYHRSNGGKKPISQIEWKIPSNAAEKLIPVGSKIEIWGCA